MTEEDLRLRAGLPRASQLARIAGTCLNGVLRFDYLSPSRPAGPDTRTEVQAKSGWRPRKSETAATAVPAQRLPARMRELSSTEEYRLVQRARAGCAASRAKLIEQHLPLVASIARRFDSRRVPFDDLVSEGCIGLMTAVEKFDAERGFRLSTYARWWIGQSIALAIMNQSNLVRVPVHVQRSARKAMRQEQANAVPADTANEAEASPEEPPSTADPELARELEAETPAYIPAIDLGDELLASIASPEEEQPLNVLWRLEKHVVLEAALRGLSEREQYVVRTRFGLDNDESNTLEAIARHLNLSEERVRQILKAAIRKLRAEIGRYGYSDGADG